MKSYIYKIYSTDNKLNYYGLTTKTIQDRFKQHLDNYITQKKNNYCATQIIFQNYSLENIQMQIIEEFDDIPLQKLRDRELYYIQNFHCVNIMGKKKYSLSGYYTLSNIKILSSQIKLTNIPIIQPTPQIYNIIYTLGYILQNNTLTHIRQVDFYNIKDKLLQAITTDYPQDQIKSNNLLQITNDILHKHQLQILHKTQFFTKNKQIILHHILLHPTIHDKTHQMQDKTQTHDTHDNITTHNYPSNASNKISIDITLDKLDFSDLPHNIKITQL